MVSLNGYVRNIHSQKHPLQRYKFVQDGTSLANRPQFQHRLGRTVAFLHFPVVHDSPLSPQVNDQVSIPPSDHPGGVVPLGELESDHLSFIELPRAFVPGDLGDDR
jgi:hypothetical protein